MVVYRQMIKSYKGNEIWTDNAGRHCRSSLTTREAAWYRISVSVCLKVIGSRSRSQEPNRSKIPIPAM